jgi:hypothetical protein
MMNEVAVSLLEVLKANKSKQLDLNFAIEAMQALASAEYEARGVNCQILGKDLVPFVSGSYRATPDPSIQPSWIDEGDGVPRPNPRHPRYPHLGPAPIMPPDGQPALASDPVPAQPLDADAIENAVVRALERVLPPTLTNRGHSPEALEPPTVAPPASATEAAAWSPVVAPEEPPEGQR